MTNGTSALIVPYLRTELGFKSDARYAGPWGGGWPSSTSPRADWTAFRFDFGTAGAQGNPAADLADAMRSNAALRVLVIHGYFDLLTPYIAAGYAVIQMGLDPMLRRNVLFANYAGGHTMYTEKANMTRLTHDVGEFIRSTTPTRHPTPSVQ